MPTASRPQVTYKGITPETQEAVRSAARSMGMSIGAWVEKALQHAVNNPSIVTGDRDYVILLERINRLETKMEFLLKDYNDRHRIVESNIPVTHTGRLAAEMRQG
jgi:hypothetical protein